jgi:serine/threonine protein kinase
VTSPLFDDQPLSPGRTLERGFGRYVVDQVLGSGAMGTVYRAWLFYAPAAGQTPREPVLVALKQLNRKSARHPALRAFFSNEAEALRRLDHPNVVRFYELFAMPTAAHPASFAPPVEPKDEDDTLEAGPIPIIAMEHVEGDTLEAVIGRSVARARQTPTQVQPALPFERAWYYLQQVLGALAAGHALGIVHRDVKPSNILIRRDGIVKMTDYGISHVVNPSHGEVAPSPQELSPGTGAYMSPEQVLGRDIDGRSDLYSVAIVLYEAIAGRTPFLSQNRTEFSLRMDQVHTPPPPLRQFAPHASPALEYAFQRALSKAPEHRFASAIEMGEAFRDALGIPSTPAWRALGDLAGIANTAGSQDPDRAAKVATLRQIIARSFATQPMAARPARPRS